MKKYSFLNENVIVGKLFDGKPITITQLKLLAVKLKNKPKSQLKIQKLITNLEKNNIFEIPESVVVKRIFTKL